MSRRKDSSEKYFVYKHTAPNGKVYIGITCKINPQKRWNNGAGYQQQKHFYNAILKYGWDNFRHEIILFGLDKLTACQKEVELIAEYQSMNPKYGYNTRSGGDTGAVLSVLARKEESERVKKWWDGLSDEKRQYMETHLRKISKAWWNGVTKEARMARITPCLKARKAAWDALTPEERKVVIHKGDAKRKATLESRTPEQIAEQSKKCSVASSTRWQKTRNALSKMSPEEQAEWHKKRGDIVRKAWITRKANIEAARNSQQQNSE